MQIAAKRMQFPAIKGKSLENMNFQSGPCFIATNGNNKIHAVAVTQKQASPFDKIWLAVILGFVIATVIDAAWYNAIIWLSDNFHNGSGM
jgi:hypothetical protein